MRKIGLLDWIAYIFVAFICVFLFVNISTLVMQKNIELFAVDSPLIFALLVAIVLSVCLLISLYKDFVIKKEVTDDNREKFSELLNEIRGVFIFTIVIIIYTLIIKRTGFLLGTTIFMVIGMSILNTDKSKIQLKLGKALIATLITIPTMYYIFHDIFNVMLP